MKTQLISLEAHDDLISIRDRMSWAKTPRILLVWPTSIRVSLRQLDLKVLLRHAASLGAQLGLVTRLRNVRREAQALDIPVFNSTGEAQRSPWPEHDLGSKREWRAPRRDLREKQKQVRVQNEAWPILPIVRIGSFTLGVFAVLAVASLFVPRALIIIEPETTTQNTAISVRADPSIKEVFLTGSVPSQKIQILVDGELEKLTTGSVPVPQSISEGEVTFRNLTENEVSIPSGTVLTSTGLPGVRFLTMEDAELPPGLKATADVPIQAESAGAMGNVEAETILAIESNLGLLVAVTNNEPTQGGADRITNAASETDLARLREDLLDELKHQALRELDNGLESYAQIFPDTISVEQIIEEAYDPPLGQPSRKVRLSLQVEFGVSYASGDDLTELARTVLNASKTEGYSPVEASLKIDKRDNVDTDSKGVSRWTMRVSRELEKQIDERTIVQIVQGRQVDVAAKKLEEQLQSANFQEIHLTPDWWPWLPLIPFNIAVET